MLVKVNVFFLFKVDCSEILCVGIRKNSILLPNILYMVWIKSYLHVHTNVEILCIKWNNLGIINCIKLLAAKSNSMGLESLFRTK